MKKRLALAVIALVLTACVAAFYFRPGSSITADAYQRIQLGMTRQQVNDLLGGPARNETNNLMAGTHHVSYFGPGPFVFPWPEEWWGPDIVIAITFDAQDRVCTKQMETHDYGPEKKPSLWEEACSWLPWSR